MSKELVSSIDIAAAERVWEILVDFDAFSRGTHLSRRRRADWKLAVGSRSAYSPWEGRPSHCDPPWSR